MRTPSARRGRRSRRRRPLRRRPRRTSPRPSRRSVPLRRSPGRSKQGPGPRGACSPAEGDVMSEFDFNSGGEGEAGAGQAEDSAPELSEIALGPEKSTAGRNTAMILMAFAAVGAATIYFMRLKSGPESAGAATPQVEKDAKKANDTIKKFLQEGGKKSLADVEKLLKDAEELVKEFRLHEHLPQLAIKTNPF